MSALWRVLRSSRSGRTRWLLALVLGVLAAGAAVVLAGVSAWLVTTAAEQPPVLHLMVAIVAVRAAGIGRGVFRYFERLVGHDASFRVLADLRVAVVRRVERLLPGSRTLGRGDLLTRFVNDVDGLADLWVRILLPAAVTVVVSVGAVVVVGSLLPIAGVALVCSAAVAMVVAPAVSMAVSGRSAARVAPQRGAYGQRLLTVLDGAAELAVYGAVDAALGDLDSADRSLRRTEARVAWGAGLGAAVAVLAAGAGLVATMWLGARAVGSGDIDGVTLAVVVLLPLSVHELVAVVTPAAAQLPALRTSAERLVAVVDEPDVVRDPSFEDDLPEGPWDLRLRGLTVGWPGGPALLRDLSLTVTSGSTVGLVGPSGLGKSTLAATLLRFVEPLDGAIELVSEAGAVDISRLRGDRVRSVIGWCAQDAHVFDSTVAANLRLARPSATDDELRSALSVVQLDDWLVALPHGLDSMVGEHGRSMSGGERQRLALARVVLSGAPIVVVDEPTEHVDDTMAGALMTDLVSALADRTMIVITHRPDLLPPHVHVVDLAEHAPPHSTGADASNG
ncbi:MAG: thiol reductant ABC exporter subunit CydC [Actinobacteria bacterium]|nr:thiol reductant ABC exporter subunit CydC [Actinomycetota bacterium]